jgi:hypothetical protein
LLLASAAAAVTGIATITDATGDIGGIKVGAANVTGTAIVSADANVSYSGEATVTGVGTVTLATAKVDHSAIASVSGVATIDARAHLNIILGVPFAPNEELTSLNFSGDYTDIDDDPYDIDGNWLDVIDETSVCIYIAGLPDSLQYKVIHGVGLHSIAVTVRKNSPGGTDPTISCQLYSAANPREEVIDAETVTSTTSEVHTGTFGLMPASDYDNLALLRVLIGGTSSGNRNIDIGAMRVYLAMEGTRIKASVSGAATITDATGGLRLDNAAADVTGIATITTADSNVTYSGEASVTGIATVTDATAKVLYIASASVTGVATITNADADIILGTTASVSGVATVTDATAEVLYIASASVTGVATITNATGDIGGIQAGAANVTGIATIFADPNVSYSGDASVTGVCTVNAISGVIRSTSATVTGIASVNANADRILGTTVSVNGIATTLADGIVSYSGASSVTGIATVVGNAIVNYSAAASVSGVASVNAEPDLIGAITYGRIILVSNVSKSIRTSSELTKSIHAIAEVI